MRIAVIGAGISGLSCCEALAGQGHQLAVFDKARGPGGRMSTRRVALGEATLRFDHGAQYFTVRDPRFAVQVAAWQSAGVAARWPAAGPDAWVGTPGMNAPVKAMAARHAVSWQTRIEALEARNGAWQLRGAGDAGRFDAVVVALPAEQAAELVRSVHPGFADRAAAVPSAPCWTVMLAFAEPIPTERHIVREAGAIGWATRDGSKPGRGDAETWVVQATPAWSAAHLELAPEDAAGRLLPQFEAAIGTALPPLCHLSAHRWRYARSGAAGPPGALWDGEARLGVCGDWLIAPRVEAAWLSGRHLAEMIGAPAP